jgi:hypothetical protein
MFSPPKINSKPPQNPTQPSIIPIKPPQHTPPENESTPTHTEETHKPLQPETHTHESAQNTQKQQNKPSGKAPKAQSSEEKTTNKQAEKEGEETHTKDASLHAKKGKVRVPPAPRGDIGAQMIALGLRDKVLKTLIDGLQAVRGQLGKDGLQLMPDWGSRLKAAELLLDRMEGPVPDRREVLMLTKQMGEEGDGEPATPELVSAMKSILDRVDRANKVARAITPEQLVEAAGVLDDEKKKEKST